MVVAPDGPRGQLADHVTDWYVREESWAVPDTRRENADAADPSLPDDQREPVDRDTA